MEVRQFAAPRREGWTVFVFGCVSLAAYNLPPPFSDFLTWALAIAWLSAGATIAYWLGRHAVQGIAIGIHCGVAGFHRGRTEGLEAQRLRREQRNRS